MTVYRSGLIQTTDFIDSFPGLCPAVTCSTLLPTFFTLKENEYFLHFANKGRLGLHIFDAVDPSLIFGVFVHLHLDFNSFSYFQHLDIKIRHCYGS